MFSDIHIHVMGSSDVSSLSKFITYFIKALKSMVWVGKPLSFLVEYLTTCRPVFLLQSFTKEKEKINKNILNGNWSL